MKRRIANQIPCGETNLEYCSSQTTVHADKIAQKGIVEVLLLWHGSFYSPLQHWQNYSSLMKIQEKYKIYYLTFAVQNWKSAGKGNRKLPSWNSSFNTRSRTEGGGTFAVDFELSGPVLSAVYHEIVQIRTKTLLFWHLKKWNAGYKIEVSTCHKVFQKLGPKRSVKCTYQKSNLGGKPNKFLNGIINPAWIIQIIRRLFSQMCRLPCN